MDEDNSRHGMHGPHTTRHSVLSVLQCVAACCSVLQCVAACCSVLQLQCDAVSYVGDSDRNVRRAAICCSCSVLQNMVSFLGLFYKRDL